MRKPSTTTSVDELIHVLRHKRTLPARIDAIRQLTHIGGSRAVKALCAALDYNEPALRKAAANGLAALKDATAVRALESALSDDEFSVRDAVIEALESIGSTNAIKVLRKALSDAEQSIRLKAATSLANIGTPSALQTLGYALQDNALAQEAVTQALLTTSVEQSLQVLAGLMCDRRQRAQQILVSVFQTLGQDHTFAILEAALSTRGWKLSVSAVEMMARTCGRRVIEALTHALERV